MRIVCPSCQAAYAVPDAALAARRTMRCARCSAEFPAGGLGDWVGPAAADVPGGVAGEPDGGPMRVAPGEPEPGAAEPGATKLGVGGEPVAVAVAPGMTAGGPVAPGSLFEAAAVPVGAAGEARRVRVAVAAGWVVSVVVLACLGWSAMRWREPIVRAWPAASRGYAVLGYR